MNKSGKRHIRIGDAKWCFCCKRYRHVSYFYKNKSAHDGLDHICRYCKGAYYKNYQAEYYQKHHDELLPKHRFTAKLSYMMRKEIAKNEER